MFKEDFYDKIILLVYDGPNTINKVEYLIANITFSGDFIIVNKFNPEDNSIESTPYSLKIIDKYKTY
jgi:hypothetical protein